MTQALTPRSQATAASRIIESGEAIAVSAIVLCEPGWALRRAYRLGVAEIADAIQDIIASHDVIVDRPAAEAGLDLLRRGGDFANGVLWHDANRARCRTIVTFDAGFAAPPGNAALVLLG